MKPLNIKALLFEGYAEANSDPKKWPTYDGKFLDRTQYVTASEVGKCSRMIKLGKLGKPMPFDRWGFAERGHIIEAWAAHLIRLGSVGKDHAISHTGDEQVSFYHGAQSGTPDGIIRLANGSFETLEIKSIDPRTNLKNLPKPEQVDQVQQNMDLLSVCWNVPVMGSHLIHINASDLQTIREQYIPADFDRQAELEQRAIAIMEAKSPDDLRPEGMFVDKGCQYCDFKEQCSSMVASKKTNAATMKRLEGVGSNVFK